MRQSDIKKLVFNRLLTQTMKTTRITTILTVITTSNFAQMSSLVTTAGNACFTSDNLSVNACSIWVVANDSMRLSDYGSFPFIGMFNTNQNSLN